MKDAKALNAEERQMLSFAPVSITLFAANHDGLLTRKENQTAKKLIRIKAFSAPPSIRFLFKEEEPVFEKKLARADRELPAGLAERHQVLNQHFSRIGLVFNTLTPSNQAMLLHNWKSFLWHISRLHERNDWEELVLPCVIDYIHYHNPKSQPVEVLQKLLNSR